MTRNLIAHIHKLDAGLKAEQAAHEDTKVIGGREFDAPMRLT